MTKSVTVIRVTQRVPPRGAIGARTFRCPRCKWQMSEECAILVNGREWTCGGCLRADEDDTRTYIRPETLHAYQLLLQESCPENRS